MRWIAYRLIVGGVDFAARAVGMFLAFMCIAGIWGILAAAFLMALFY